LQTCYAKCLSMCSGYCELNALFYVCRVELSVLFHFLFHLSYSCLFLCCLFVLPYSMWLSLRKAVKLRYVYCVVPMEWLVDDVHCVWPPYRKQKQIDQAVRCRQLPQETWEVYDIRILGSAGILLLLLHILLL